MAQYTVNHKCGHSTNHSLLGKHDDRYRKIEWLETQDCEECRNAAFNAANAEAAAEIIASPEAANLPHLTGSEKQANWATTIRAEKLAAAEAYLERLRIGDPGSRTPEQVTEILALMGRAFDRFKSLADSRYWIDSRQERAESMMNAIYQELKAAK